MHWSAAVYCISGPAHMSTSSSRLFIAIATGQNIANLPPILELAEKGDAVLWILSLEARTGKYAEGSERVLKHYGLERLKPLNVRTVSEPATLVRELRAWFATRPKWAAADTYVVLSGGTKLSAIGLEHGVQNERRCFLYSADQPVELWRFEGRLDRPPQRQPYKRCQLDLPDILVANRSATYEKQVEGTRIWPACQIRTPEYGRDVDHTIAWHEDAYFCADAGNQTTEDDTEWNIARVCEVLGSEYLANKARALLSELADRSSTEIYQRLYAIRAQWMEEAKAKRKRALYVRRYGAIGPAFERFVAYRVQRFLNNTRCSIVKSAWANVAVSREDEKGQARGELDVAVVLRNGIVLHLECKAGQPAVKDLYARITALQRATSRLARMYVCLPAIPAAQPLDETASVPGWFALQERTREILENASLQIIDVDVGLERRSSYVRNGQRVEVVPFERSLERILAPFLPEHERQGRDRSQGSEDTAQM